MSSFTTPLVLVMLPKRRFKVNEEFIYYVGDRNDNQTIKVHEGFITDLATIPRILWPFLPPHGIYGKAAVLHDFMYTHKIRNKQYADAVFLEAMKVLKVPVITQTLLYYSVKLFGKGSY